MKFNVFVGKFNILTSLDLSALYNIDYGCQIFFSFHLHSAVSLLQQKIHINTIIVDSVWSPQQFMFHQA
jgi:hypothetical protein